MSSPFSAPCTSMSLPVRHSYRRLLVVKYSVYPLIDPTSHFASKTFKDKVVIITGGSTGIGATTALFYARAGAKVLIVARRLEKLEETKKDIESDVPDAQIIVLAGDASEPEVGKRVVKAAVQAWGRIDIVVSNQFSMTADPTGSTFDGVQLEGNEDDIEASA